MVWLACVKSYFILFINAYLSLACTSRTQKDFSFIPSRGSQFTFIYLSVYKYHNTGYLQLFFNLLFSCTCTKCLFIVIFDWYFIKTVRILRLQNLCKCFIGPICFWRELSVFIFLSLQPIGHLVVQVLDELPAKSVNEYRWKRAQNHLCLTLQ